MKFATLLVLLSSGLANAGDSNFDFVLDASDGPSASALEDQSDLDVEQILASDREAYPAEACLDCEFVDLSNGDASFSEKSASIPKLAQVTPSLFRGGRPDAQGLSQLAQRGIRMVINLENDASAIRQEQQVAARLRLGWISMPMSASVSPDDREVNQILALLRDTSRGPIFIHCKFGEDRTGLVIGLYRVLVQGWAPAQAYQEMLRMGFHPQFTKLVEYFRAKTGWVR